MNIDFEAMAVLEEESQNELSGGYATKTATGAEGSERREGGKRGRRPGRKAQLDKQDMKAKLERSRQLGVSAEREVKLQFQVPKNLLPSRSFAGA
ncbi:unnamed protein product [Leptosia nina]|uniref:Uncharacterized protein n=1 Tax=Leptosia nina TaxID=320188 RepID=A0AAV1IZJ3_9NEOP